MSAVVLSRIDIESGVSAFTGEPFCRVGVLNEHGKQIGFAQLPPSEVRGMALQWLSAADAAENDAAVWAELKSVEIPEDVAGQFMMAVRRRRMEK